MTNETQSWEATGAAPPIVYRWAWPLALGALIAVAMGAIIGSIADAPKDAAGDRGVAAALRVFFTIGGMLAAGLAVSLRPSKAALVGMAAVTWLVACYGGGFHSDWDSAKMVAGFGAIVAGVAAAIMAGPVGLAWLFGMPGLIRPLQRAGLSLLVLFHFGGLCVAVTGPTPQPWLSAELTQVVYRPWQQCVYLTNAYH